MVQTWACATVNFPVSVAGLFMSLVTGKWTAIEVQALSGGGAHSFDSHRGLRHDLRNIR
jgi:hypothetical protein